MTRLEDIEELGNEASTETTDEYFFRWIIGHKRFKSALCGSGYTEDEVLEELEICRLQLGNKIAGRIGWSAYELDFLEEYLDLNAPDR